MRSQTTAVDEKGTATKVVLLTLLFLLSVLPVKAQNTTVHQGLIAYYTFDGNANEF